MKRGAQLAFGLSVLFLFFFLLGLTDAGQKILGGPIPPNASHSQLDDIYMGAGLAPWVYGLGPCILLAFIGGALVLAQRFKRW
jgi:hypothetical protein